MGGWIAFGISGWIACMLVIGIDRRRHRPHQLQETVREYASERRRWQVEKGELIKAHQAQMDAIHAEVIAFEVDERYRDPERVRYLLDHLRNKTTPRSRRRPKSPGR